MKSHSTISCRMTPGRTPTVTGAVCTSKGKPLLGSFKSPRASFTSYTFKCYLRIFKNQDPISSKTGYTLWQKTKTLVNQITETELLSKIVPNTMHILKNYKVMMNYQRNHENHRQRWEKKKNQLYETDNSIPCYKPQRNSWRCLRGSYLHHLIREALLLKEASTSPSPS